MCLIFGIEVCKRYYISVFVFFFKQKTAYEMRISDWSSDVCSSDLLVRNAGELARTVIATRNGVPITVEQVATVKTGQAIRMGSASENGTEVVVGTAIMRIGENSRVVSTAVAEKLKTINASLPPDVVIQPVLNRTELVNSTIKTVAKNLSEGAVLDRK